MKIRSFLGLCCGVALATGCATTRTYPLAVSGDQASSTLDPLAACATKNNLESRKVVGGVDVKVDEVAMLHYDLSGGTLVMNVRVDDERVPQGELDNKFLAVKALGDKLFACAQSGEGTGATAAPPTAANSDLANQNLQGNWMAHVDYKWSCTIPMAKAEHGNDTGSWSMTISGAPTQLSAQVNTTPTGYAMLGSQSQQGLRLCGAFPLRGHGSPAELHDNNICMVVSEVADVTKLRGHLEGDYATSVANCKITEAKLELTR